MSEPLLVLTLCQWKNGEGGHLGCRNGNFFHQELFILRTFHPFSANWPCGEKISILSYSQSYFSSLDFFFNNLCLITKVIYVHSEIALILKFINHAWFGVKLENDYFFSNPNCWQLASKQSLELYNSEFSRKTFRKGPTSLLEPMVSKQLLSTL